MPILDKVTQLLNRLIKLSISMMGEYFKDVDIT